MTPLASATLHGTSWPALPTVGPAAHGALTATRAVDRPGSAPGLDDTQTRPGGVKAPGRVAYLTTRRTPT